MMTPAEEEIEYIIKEIAVYDKIDTKSYTIKSFPEIFLKKHTYHYTVNILKDCRQNNVVNKRFEELKNEFRNMKITFENKIIDIDRKILFHGNASTTATIYYKDCIFTSSYIVIDEYCENCIVEKE